MSGSKVAYRRFLLIAADVLVAVIGTFDVWVNCDLPLATWQVAIAALTGCALLVRRHAPIVAFVLSLPAVALIGSLLGPMAALYSVARSAARRWVVVVTAVLVGSLCLLTAPFGDNGFEDLDFLLHEASFAVLVGVGPAALGWLVATRQRLVRQMAEIDRVYAQERERHATVIRDRERAELAREMHDVVSHQVSLIAVQAGALQIVSSDPDARSTAEVIRELSVDTLDELRHMVKVLRAPGVTGEITPQPTLKGLAVLLAKSCLPVEWSGQLPENLTPAVERAIYRTIQEALTNVRKHAPDAAVSIVTETTDSTVTIVITNVRSEQAPVALPGAGSGISGLQQRAELLGGTVTARPTPDGGWTLQLQLPRI